MSQFGAEAPSLLAKGMLALCNDLSASLRRSGRRPSPELPCFPFPSALPLDRLLATAGTFMTRTQRFALFSICKGKLQLHVAFSVMFGGYPDPGSRVQQNLKMFRMCETFPAHYGLIITPICLANILQVLHLQKRAAPAGHGNVKVQFQQHALHWATNMNS